MSNTSILAAFERMWQHVTSALGNKSDEGHVHDDRYYTETEVDSKISNVNKSITNIVNGTTTVKKSESATTATTASNAEKLGNQLPSYYAAASAIPTGALAKKSIVTESDLDSTLAEKVNAAAQGNHSHSNKTVLDGITSTKVSAWDNAESNAKTYADSAVSSHVNNANAHVTTTNKTNWNDAYTHSTSAHAPSTAEKNIIVGIQKNGTDLSVNSSTRKVNITVPTTAAEVGAAPSSHKHDDLYDVKGAASGALTSAKAYSDANLSTAKTYTDGKIDALVGEGASTTLDTIGEISAAIEGNQDMIETLNSAIGNKVDKVSGKGLSTNDLTSTLKSNYDAAYTHTSNKNNPHGVTLSQLGVTATSTELNYVDGVTSAIQTQLDGKQATISGGASTIASSNLTASRALISNGSGKVAVSAVTSTELGYLDGVTSAIQTQLDGKSPSGHGHDAATQSAAGFMSANDKKKLDGITESADSVAFSQGLTSGAEVGTITINGSGTKLYAPLNTNTTYDLTTSQTSGQNVKLNLVAGGSGSGTDSIEIKGGGATSVYRDTTTGAIIIESTDHDTTYGAAGTSLGLVKSGGDVTISSGLITVNDDSHNHVISNVDGLQAALDAKSDSSHTHNYAGSSSAGGAATSANKVNSSLTIQLNSGSTEGTNKFTFNGSGAKSVNITPSSIGAATSGHNHDDVYCAKTSFDTHTADTTAHMTSAQKTQLTTAYNHSQADHAPSNAQANQNAFSNIAVSGQTTVAADTTTDTVTFVGSNVSITTDATNDKVTFTVADGSTSTKGVVQLTNSTSSTSTTTAATPSSVKSAYDLANTAKTNAATAQAKADSAYTLASGKVGSLSDLGITATASELNFVDGVTSNIQTQLDAKAPAMGVAYIDENDNETVILGDYTEIAALIGGDA